MDNAQCVDFNPRHALYWRHITNDIKIILDFTMKKNNKKSTVKPKKTSPVLGKSDNSTKSVAKVAKSSIQPLGDRILIKPFLDSDVEKKNDFGIIIPETVSKESPEKGKVIAVGEGRYDNGKIVPMKVKVGDTVIFSKYGFDEVKVDGSELYILKEDSVLAIINK